MAGTENPIDKIEEKNGQIDLGRMAVRVYVGAAEEAEGDPVLAFRATVAYFIALMRAANVEGEAEEEGEERT